MKLNKIRMIEQPNEEIILDTEAMQDLLGGIICGVFTGSRCTNYSDAKCSSIATFRCDDYAY